MLDALFNRPFVVGDLTGRNKPIRQIGSNDIGDGVQDGEQVDSALRFQTNKLSVQAIG